MIQNRKSIEKYLLQEELKDISTDIEKAISGKKEKVALLKTLGYGGNKAETESMILKHGRLVNEIQSPDNCDIALNNKLEHLAKLPHLTESAPYFRMETNIRELNTLKETLSELTRDRQIIIIFQLHSPQDY